MKQTFDLSEKLIFFKYTVSVMKNYAYNMRQRLNVYQEPDPLFKMMKSVRSFNSSMV